jgi:hypothetical protein
MRKAVLVVLLLSAPVASACFQALDTTASSGQPIVQPPPESDAGLSTVILPGARPFGFFDDNGQPVTSDTACDATRVQATSILTKYCAACHGGRTPGERAGSPPFDFVLDPVKLTSTWTLNTTPPSLFVVPGDPDHSMLYLRARRGEMPPASEAQLPRPTISDLSVLNQWISNCLGKAPPPTTTTGGGGAGGAGSGSAGAGGSGTQGAAGQGGAGGAAGGGKGGSAGGAGRGGVGGGTAGGPRDAGGRG